MPRGKKVKALTLYQPWAQLIVMGFKRYETRSWATNHRGLLAIHAGVNPAKVTHDLRSFLRFAGFMPADIDRILQVGCPTGCIVGLVSVSACLDAYQTRFSITKTERYIGDWGRGRKAWRLDNPQPLSVPVTCTGHQKLWTVPDSIEREIWKQWEREA